jgi:hypothetical protein
VAKSDISAAYLAGGSKLIGVGSRQIKKTYSLNFL